MYHPQQIWIKREKGYVRLLCRNRVVTVLGDVEIPTTIPSSPHVNERVNVRGKMVPYIVYISIASYFPLRVFQRHLHQMKAEPRHENEGDPTNSKWNQYVTHQPRRTPSP